MPRTRVTPNAMCSFISPSSSQHLPCNKGKPTATFHILSSNHSHRKCIRPSHLRALLPRKTDAAFHTQHASFPVRRSCCRTCFLFATLSASTPGTEHLLKRASALPKHCCIAKSKLFVQRASQTRCIKTFPFVVVQSNHLSRVLLRVRVTPPPLSLIAKPGNPLKRQTITHVHK